jgi:hypothetical protein
MVAMFTGVVSQRYMDEFKDDLWCWCLENQAVKIQPLPQPPQPIGVLHSSLGVMGLE